MIFRGQYYAASLLPGNWPTGKDGPLIVNPAQTVIIPFGSVKDYSSIYIYATGTLQIADGDGWTFVGCAGNLTVLGTLEARNGPTGVGGSFSSNTPRGHNAALSGPPVNYSIVQNIGGTGASGVASGGNEAFGNGGGGGGGPSNNGGDATLTNGGLGGNATIFGCPGNSIGGGAGAGVWGNDGGGGATPGVCCGPTMRSAGGGGGSRGYHGQGLYMKIGGSIIGSGTIDVRGRNGGNGGNGGSNGPCTTQGGGGGGGAGGSGGYAYINHHGSLLGGFSIANVLATKGFGGVGGGGFVGAPGSDGNDGTAQLVTY